MASRNSYADVVTDWGKLLEAAQRSPDVQPSIDSERQTLAQLLTEVQDLKARQDELTAQRQDVTQQLTASVKRGKDVAIQIRSVVKGKIGPRSERLVHFKVAPLRKRQRRPVVVETPGGENPGTVAGAQASPSDPPAA